MRERIIAELESRIQADRDRGPCEMWHLIVLEMKRFVFDHDFDNNKGDTLILYYPDAADTCPKYTVRTETTPCEFIFYTIEQFADFIIKYYC